ncbi:MAG: hypothetical protein KGJ41_05700 [Rhodospirillales bacterium]|nr:hypothetical protein [Rhodospirillales bacterium]MDE2198500.1 hypothetical protein [Rhodospirillales bacterium]MDE2573706.1 hypothetical protein [Rhodospirillales bacterium]
MPNFMAATLAYSASSANRSLREQEADVFLLANAALRSASDPSSVERVRAVADNARLWNTVIDLLRDPGNNMDQKLRASIISVGMAVQRETQSAAPNVEFLLEINENIAAGLAGRP